MGHGQIVQEGGSANEALSSVIEQNRERNSNVPWYKNRGIRNLNLLLLLVLITSSTNGYDGSMMNGLQGVQNWIDYFGNPQGQVKGILNAIQNIGSLLALPFSPIISDRYGRRYGIILGAAIMLAATAIQSASQNIGMFIAARGIIGFGLGFAANAAPLLITELAYPTQRGPYTSLYNSTWYLGSIIAAWTTFGTFAIPTTWSWRIPSILMGLPSVLQVFLIWIVPESPRWLIAHGREEEARDILAKYHANGDRNDALVVFECNEIKNALELRRRLRGKLLGNGLVSYYLVDVLKSIGIQDDFLHQLINGILQLWNYFTAICGALAVDRAGRRTLFLTSNVGMLVSFVIWTACSGVYQVAVNEGRTPPASAGHAVIAMIFLFYTAYNLAYSPLLVAYTVEILPFQIRAKGLAFMNFFVSLALVFNQYVNPIALSAITWKYYLVFSVWLAFELIFAYFFIIETKGHTLEEIAALFDGKADEIQVGADVRELETNEVVVGKAAV
ncbi:hypothetical protein HDV00_003435 [Rhizophlyctis rosea]|nr:hypothetical protein HDV00_003435 [Rhizophlyctis rosea]